VFVRDDTWQHDDSPMRSCVYAECKQPSYSTDVAETRQVELAKRRSEHAYGSQAEINSQSQNDRTCQREGEAFEVWLALPPGPTPNIVSVRRRWWWRRARRRRASLVAGRFAMVCVSWKPTAADLGRHIRQ
jgi:hypothetical protein